MMNNITQLSIIHDEQGTMGTMPLLGMSITTLCFSCISGILLFCCKYCHKRKDLGDKKLLNINLMDVISDMGNQISIVWG